MSLGEVRDGLREAINPILRTADSVDNLRPPCAFVGLPDTIELLTSFGGGWTYTIPVVLFAVRGSERSAVDTLERWLSESGDDSVVAAIHADPTLGGACSSLICQTVTDIGETVLGEGTVAVSCLTARLLVEVYT